MFPLFKNTITAVLGRPVSPQITCEPNLGLNGMPSQPTGVNGKPERVSENNDGGVFNA